ncbi:MAG TPA: Hsp20/alpha crystallin family protein [Gemmatimonadales bacterium]|jgi:HSP20 family protein|nr:Hsp20/alpha crystallin family protein [Gemmatimonadales bacterium]
MVTSNYLVLSNRLNRLFNDVWGDVSTADNGTSAWFPTVNVVEDNGETRISAEIPGVSPDAVKVSVESSVLSIEGQKTGFAFKRAFTLPATVDAEGIKATYEHGVLTVSLPKAEKAKARQIAVETIKA